MTEAALRAVMEAEPQLNIAGLGSRKLPEQTPEEYETSVSRLKAELADSVESFEKVCAWLSGLERSDINTTRSSYGWKHVAEQRLGSYVANGVLIAAAIHCKIPYRRIPDTPNAYLGISEASAQGQPPEQVS